MILDEESVRICPKFELLHSSDDENEWKSKKVPIKATTSGRGVKK